MNAESTLLLEYPAPGVALLRLNRPAVRNALNTDLRLSLASRFCDLTEDATIRVIVLTGAGGHFAAGADLAELAAANPVELIQRQTHRLWQTIADCPKPVIAAVEGFALGGGCELAMHADIIVAADSARFGQPEVKVGIMPGAGGTQRLVRAIGKYRAMHLLLTGAFLSAQDAHIAGLVSELAPDGGALDAALKLAVTIAAMPPLAVQQIKEVVLAGMDAPLTTALALERKAFQLMFASDDQKEGMRAFLEKRPAQFLGR